MTIPQTCYVIYSKLTQSYLGDYPNILMFTSRENVDKYINLHIAEPFHSDYQIQSINVQTELL